jgi:hypothetical protein
MGVTTALLTVEEYAQLPEEETMRTELVEGEIVRMGDARVTDSNLNTHQPVKANCIAILEDYIRRNPAWRLFSEYSPQLALKPFPPRALPTWSGRSLHIGRPGFAQSGLPIHRSVLL